MYFCRDAQATQESVIEDMRIAAQGAVKEKVDLQIHSTTLEEEIEAERAALEVC